MDDYYDEKAAARIAKVHPRTIRRWRNRGLLAHYRTPSGRIRYRAEDLLAAVAAERIDEQGRKCPLLSSSAQSLDDFTAPMLAPCNEITLAN